MLGDKEPAGQDGGGAPSRDPSVRVCRVWERRSSANLSHPDTPRCVFICFTALDTRELRKIGGIKIAASCSLHRPPDPLPRADHHPPSLTAHPPTLTTPPPSSH